MTMTWLQQLAWEEAFRTIERAASSKKQMKEMGFKSLNEVAGFEARRVLSLGKAGE